MSFIATFLTQTATIWEVDSVGENGEAAFAATSPRDISVRWEDKTEIYIDEGGLERRATSVIYSDEELDTGDWIALGSLDDSDPTVLTDASRIVAKMKSPSISGTEYVRKYLV